MNDIELELCSIAYKPFDIVSDKDGNVGYIREVDINDYQWMIQYAVCWLTGNNKQVAWFSRRELTKHSNLFVKMAQSSCNNAGRNEKYVPILLGNTSEEEGE